MSTAPLVDSRKDYTDHTFTYKTVALKDGNTWLAESFNYYKDTPQNEGCQGWHWSGESLQSRTYGVYYQLETLMSVVPEGWHIPTVEEWTAMINCYGGIESCYGALIKGGSSGLDLNIAGGNYFTKQECGLRDFGFYWSSSVSATDDDCVSVFRLQQDIKKAELLDMRKTFQFNARLVKD